jgi:cell division septation protein DedD
MDREVRQMLKKRTKNPKLKRGQALLPDGRIVWDGTVQDPEPVAAAKPKPNPKPVPAPAAKPAPAPEPEPEPEPEPTNGGEATC